MKCNFILPRFQEGNFDYPTKIVKLHLIFCKMWKNESIFQALLSFNRCDRIRMLNFDPQVAAAVKLTILR